MITTAPTKYTIELMAHPPARLAHNDLRGDSSFGQWTGGASSQSSCTWMEYAKLDPTRAPGGPNARKPLESDG
jgi:hypothetical protein